MVWIGIAAALTALAVVRGVGLVLPFEPPAGRSERRGWVVVLFLAGVFAAGEAAALPLASLALLVGGLGLAAAGLAAQRLAAKEKEGEDDKDGRDDKGDENGRGPWSPLLGGVLAVALLAGLAWMVQWRAPVDLAAAIVVGPAAFGVRAAFAAAAFGLIALAGARRPARTPLPRDRWAWGSMAALAAGAALADLPWAALPLVAAGAGAAAVYADRRQLRQGLALAGLALLAIATAAATWEVVYRLRLRAYAAGALLAALVPPPPAERAALGRELDVHFAGRDLGELAARSPAGLRLRPSMKYSWKKPCWDGRNLSLSSCATVRIMSALFVP